MNKSSFTSFKLNQLMLLRLSIGEERIQHPYKQVECFAKQEINNYVKRKD